MSMDSAAIAEFLEQVCSQGEHPTARFWRGYWLETGHIHRLIRMIERMEPLLDPPPALLDIGGFGELLLILWKFRGLTSLHGVSLEGNCIGYGNGKLLPGGDPAAEFTIHIDQCDMERERLQHADESFDLVTSFEVLEHLRADPAFMLLEIHRVLRPDGRLLLTTPNSSCWESLARIAEFDSPFMFSSFFADGSGIGHCKEFSVKELQRLVENVGFSIEEFETLDTLPPAAGLTERNLELLHFLETHDGWKPEQRRQTQLVLARKTARPRMRMYTPLYTEDFSYVERSGDAADAGLVPLEVEGAVRQLDEKLRVSAYLAHLQDEIVSRTRWALSLEKSLFEEREAKSRLSAEFDARGQWALSLDQEVLSQRKLIDELQKELYDLRGQLKNLRFVFLRTMRLLFAKVKGRTVKQLNL
jgi:2-polyprenyl-3-methyl-5-hydroxy-6-metoxy-1,4-benzoquinol methylase